LKKGVLTPHGYYQSVTLISTLPVLTVTLTRAGNGSRFWMSHGSPYVDPLGLSYTAYGLIIIIIILLLLGIETGILLPQFNF